MKKLFTYLFGLFNQRTLFFLVTIYYLVQLYHHFRIHDYQSGIYTFGLVIANAFIWRLLVVIERKNEMIESLEETLDEMLEEAKATNDALKIVLDNLKKAKP